MLRHQVFKGTAKRGKGTMGWFYGVELHFIINNQDGIISVKVMTDNVANRKPVSEIVDQFLGCLYEDKRLYFWSIRAGTYKQGSDTDNGCKKHKIQSDKTLEPPNDPETIYY
nr:transposase [Candidatus Enterovibrio escacola]